MRGLRGQGYKASYRLWGRVSHPPGVYDKCKNEPEKLFGINKSLKKRT